MRQCQNYLEINGGLIDENKNSTLVVTNIDKFADRLKKCDVEYVHPIKEHSWGQRVFRIYDPDKHIIEIGENIIRKCLYALSFS